MSYSIIAYTVSPERDFDYGCQIVVYMPNVNQITPNLSILIIY